MYQVKWNIIGIKFVEKTGAKVHCIVSNGASTNHTFWEQVGVSEKMGKVKTYFDHPAETGRKVFVFSDTPHLIKTIRNRLYNNKVLQVNLKIEVIHVFNHVQN